jgi:hypothetical protein
VHCAIHGATVENTLFEDGDAAGIPCFYTNTIRRNLFNGIYLLTVSGHKFLA